MGTILVILILLLVWFYMIMPFIKIYRAVNNAQKNARERFRQQPPRQQHPDAAPKKKIDQTVGEYVQFTEVTETRTASDGDTTATSTTTESQVTDVTWEDV